MTDVDTEALSKSITESLASLLRRRPDEDDEDPRAGQKVPYHRFQAKVAEVNTLREQLEALGGQVAQLDTAFKAQVESLTQAAEQQVAELKAEAGTQVAEIAKRHQQDFALHELGLVDKYGRKALLDVYAEIPEAERPETPVDFYSGLIDARKAHLADPKANAAPDIPRTLAAYMPDPQQADGGTKRKGPPDTESSARPREPAGSISDIPLDLPLNEYLERLRNADG